MDDAIGILAKFSYYILKFCHSNTSKRFFQNSPTHHNVKTMFYMTILIRMPSLPVCYIGICLYWKTKVRYSWSMGVFLKLRNNCDTNWKTNWSHSNFNKNSGGPKNKEQNLSANFHNIDVCEMSAYGVPHEMSAEESLLK